MPAFEIFGFSVYWYWIFYLISFVFGYVFLYYLWKTVLLNNFPNIKKLLTTWLDDFVLFAVLGVIVWGRLWYVLFYDLAFFIQNPLNVFYIWEWWMALVWWAIWLFLATLYIKKKYKLSLKDLFVLWDLIVLIVPFGIMLVRIWNFLNQELYGKPLEQIKSFYLSWGLKDFFKSVNLLYVYENVDDKLRINTNILQSFWEWLFLFIVLMLVFFKKILYWIYRPWVVLGLFLILYWIIRFFMEFLRDDVFLSYIYGLTSTQYFMFLFIILGMLVIYIWSHKHKNP